MIFLRFEIDFVLHELVDHLFVTQARFRDEIDKNLDNDAYYFAKKVKKISLPARAGFPLF